MNTVIGGAFIENGNLLLVRKQDYWILPGGKPKEGESYIACLARELREELSWTKLDPSRVNFYHEFEGISPIRKVPIAVKVYHAGLLGSLRESSGEINAREWMSYGDMTDRKLSDVTREIVESLHSDRFL